MSTVATAAQGGAGVDERELEQFRTELTGYCYRMLGQAFEAEDAVQDTMIRAWRSLSGFDGRSSLRSWMYRIATNVCLDMLNGRKRRALPLDMHAGPSEPVHSSLGVPLTESVFVGPIPDDRVLPDDGDPAELAVAKESIRLAFIAALQHLPAKQRAVLILREVLRWKATEVAELLDTTVASVNSALQRARATIAELDTTATRTVDADTKELLERYVKAFESYDITAFVSLLHEDAIQSMPPFAMWLRGNTDIGQWMLGPGAECAGARTQLVEINGRPGMATWRRSQTGGTGHNAFSIQVLDVVDGKVAELLIYLGAELFPLFDLPVHLEAEDASDPTQRFAAISG